MVDVALLAAMTPRQYSSRDAGRAVECSVRATGAGPETCAACPFGHVLSSTASGRALKVACELRRR